MMALHGGKSLGVLVVDDEKNIRTTLAICLEGIGCRVACVGTTSSALSILAREPFDLAFVDLRLEKESGMDLNVMERVAILWPAQIVEPLAFPERIRGSHGRHPVVEIGGDYNVDQIEREHIERVLARTKTAEEAARYWGSTH
jgi:two-component SAPR family response regulator